MPAEVARPGAVAPQPNAVVAPPRSIRRQMVYADPPADPFADIDVHSDLSIMPFSLRFTDETDENTWAIWRWKLTQKLKLISLAFLLALCCAQSFEVEGEAIRSQPLYILFFLLGRLVPILTLSVSVCCLRPWMIRWWMSFASFCLLVVAVSVYLDAFLCSESTSIFSVNCDTLRDGRIPWSSAVFLILLPLVSAFGLGISWYHSLWASICSLGAFIGLVLVNAADESIATVLLAWAMATVLATVARVVADLELRVSFKREAAMRRKLTSVVGTSLARVVLHEQTQRFAEILKRMDCCLVEVNAEGIIHWVSPAAKALLGSEGDELLRCDLLKTLQAEDVPALRAGLASLAANGSAAATRATPVSFGSGFYNSANPSDLQLHNRFVYRRKRDRDVMWVEAEAYAIIRRPTIIPGVSAPTPAGETTILLVERDVTAERKRAASTPGGSVSQAGSATTVSDVPHPQPSTVPAASDAVTALATGTASLSTIAYDPFHERSMFASFAEATLPLEAAAFCVEGLLRTSNDSAVKVEAALTAQFIHSARVAIDDSMCIARFRCQHLPMRPAPGVNLSQLIRDAMHVAELQSSSRELPPPIVTLDESLPNLIATDHDVLQLIVQLALSFGLSLSSRRALQLRVTAGELVPKTPRVAASATGSADSVEPALRLALMFDPSAIGGSEIVTTALSVDPLLDNRLFSPVRPDVEAIATSRTSFGASSHYWYALPLLRQLILNLGGTISHLPKEAASGADRDTTGLEIVLPIQPFARVLSPGPTLPEMSAAAAAVANAPAEYVPPPSQQEAPNKLYPPGDAKPTVPKPEQLNMHVLFVDDEEVNRRLGARMLQKLGCTYVLLEDGDQVAAALRDTPRSFDVILMDIVMPRSDGVAVCQELREAHISVAIIAMTGHTGVRDVQRFLGAGFDVVLPKPFDIYAMRRTLLEGMARRSRVNAPQASAGNSVVAWQGAGQA